MGELSLQEYLSYAWENLWFLRPQWLYAFIAIGFIAVLMLITFRSREEWKKSIAKPLLPYLTIKGTKKQFLLPKILILVLMSLMTFALAGPTWEKIERPGQKTEAVTVVLLDLSRSMMAEDIQPNRIERAKLKLKDYFDAKPNAKTALIAYAGTAHSVVPFSKDYKTITRQMEALRPDIMPVQGSNLHEALDLADSLLTGIIAPSTIVVVTDNVSSEEVSRIAQSAVNTHIEVMAIATPNGGTIPSGRGVLKDKEGNTVIPRLEVINLDQLEALENVNVITVTLDDSDVKILAARIRQNLEFTIDLENAEEEWKDFGFWLLIPILLIGSFWFRRGWKVHWMWLLLITIGCDEAGEFKIKDQFFTADQRGQLLYEKGEKEEAAATFQSGALKGHTYYEMGELENAAEAYSEDVSPHGFYNLGVVYTEMGDLEAAKQAFSTAYELDPEMQVASTNLQLVVASIDSLALAQGLDTDTPLDSKSKSDEFQEYTEMPDEKEKAQQSDEKYEGKGDVQEMVTKEIDESTIDIFEFDENIVIDKDAAKQTLLRQVTEDPSLFLRRKFAYQNRNRTKPIERFEEQW
jgi:Ca-activated chloride channel family protein